MHVPTPLVFSAKVLRSRASVLLRLESPFLHVLENLMEMRLSMLNNAVLTNIN